MIINDVLSASASLMSYAEKIPRAYCNRRGRVQNARLAVLGVDFSRCTGFIARDFSARSPGGALARPKKTHNPTLSTLLSPRRAASASVGAQVNPGRSPWVREIVTTARGSNRPKLPIPLDELQDRDLVCVRVIYVTAGRIFRNYSLAPRHLHRELRCRLATQDTLETILES